MHTRRWIWYFAGLAVLGGLAVAIPLIVNERAQLRPDGVAAARAHWRERGPRDYDLDYEERLDTDPHADEFKVTVHDGRVTAARCNGEPAEAALTIDAMFDQIEKNLAADVAAGRRNYTIADFDLKDGHPRRYVRRVSGSHERLEWRVRLRRVS